MTDVVELEVSMQTLEVSTTEDVVEITSVESVIIEVAAGGVSGGGGNDPSLGFVLDPQTTISSANTSQDVGVILLTESWTNNSQSPSFTETRSAELGGWGLGTNDSHDNYSVVTPTTIEVHDESVPEHTAVQSDGVYIVNPNIPLSENPSWKAKSYTTIEYDQNNLPNLIKYAGGSISTNATTDNFGSFYVGGSITTDGGGSIRTDDRGGAIWTHALGGDILTHASGGKIQTYNSGGNIVTANLGGSIWTTGTGKVVLGASTTRTVLRGTASSGSQQFFPDASGYLALAKNVFVANLQSEVSVYPGLGAPNLAYGALEPWEGLELNLGTGAISRVDSGRYALSLSEPLGEWQSQTSLLNLVIGNVVSGWTNIASPQRDLLLTIKLPPSTAVANAGNTGPNGARNLVWPRIQISSLFAQVNQSQIGRVLASASGENLANSIYPRVSWMKLGDYSSGDYMIELGPNSVPSLAGSVAVYLKVVTSTGTVVYPTVAPSYGAANIRNGFAKLKSNADNVVGDVVALEFKSGQYRLVGSYVPAVADSVTSVAVGGAAAQTAGTWKTKSVDEVLDSILFPTIAPTITTPAYLTLGGTLTQIAGPVEVGYDVNGKTLTWTLNQGTITNGSGSGTVALVGPQVSVQFYGNGLTGAMPNAATSTTATSFSLLAGAKTWGVNVQHSAGSGAYYDNKNVASTSLDASRVAGTKSATYNLSVYYPVYVLKSAGTFTAAQFAAAIQAATSIVLNTDLSVTVNGSAATLRKMLVDANATITAPFAVNGQYYGVAYQTDYTEKTRFWIDLLNFGPITAVFATTQNAVSAPLVGGSQLWTNATYKFHISTGPQSSSTANIELRNV